jgi:RNA polymerase sigma-70 factor (ECF subfamily)
MTTLTADLPVPVLAAPPHPAGGAAVPCDAPESPFQLVYAEHFDLVWRSLRSLGVPSASVEDAAQDVFLVAHRRLPEFAGRSSLRTWIYGIVLQVARNHRRRERRKGGLDPLDVDVAGHGPGPDEEAEAAEALEHVAEVLGDLDEPKREVFVLGELEQMTAPEIAEALGINVNTVYSRLRAARLAFTAALERRRGDPR